MAHTFLLEAGRWTLEGNRLERNKTLSVKGKTLVGWSQDDWFTMITKLTFPGSSLDDITLAYKGRLDSDQRRFTFVLQHSVLGKVEGEGWVAPDSIVQRYWVMDDKQMRSGFDTLYRQDANHYHLTSGLIAGAYLDHTMEAVLTRQPNP